MPRGLYLLDNGDVCVEHADATRLPMPRDEYVSARINPPYHTVMSKLDFDAWVLGKRMGDAA